MLIYVLHKDGTPLMPCKPSKARKLLRDGKARVVRRTPFTIQLNWNSTKHVQELTLGVDSGSKVIGTAVRDENNKIYYLSEVHLRQDIKSRMDQRRMYRRSRRGRKTRYRKARFLNRRNSIRKDRYPPTIKNKYNTLVKELWFAFRILPTKNLIIETGTFDTHALQNPAVIYCPWLYQKGVQFGYANTKAYVLARDNYTCQYCKGKCKDPKLHAHHIIFVSNGGSDRPNNLITLCKHCHDLLHAGKIALNKRHLRSTLHHATHMNILQSVIRRNISNYKETYGYITKTIRQYFKFPKTHYNDAIFVHNFNNIKPELLVDRVIVKKCINKGTYQRTHGSRSEKVFPKGKIQGFKRWDKVLYNNFMCFVKGKMSTGYAILSDIFGSKYNFKPIPKFNKMTRLTARKSWIIAEAIIQNT